MFPCGGGFGGYDWYDPYEDDYENDYLDQFRGNEERISTLEDDLYGGRGRGPEDRWRARRRRDEEYFENYFDRRDEDPYDTDDDYSDMFSGGFAGHYGGMFGQSFFDPYRQRPATSDRADRRGDRTPREFDFVQEFRSMELGEESREERPRPRRERSRPRRNRPRNQGVRFAGGDDAEFMMSGGLGEGDHNYMPDQEEFVGVFDRPSRDRGNRRSNRRTGAHDDAVGGGEWEDVYNIYGRPFMYAGDDEYQLPQFGAAMHGLWQGNRREHDRDRRSAERRCRSR